MSNQFYELCQDCPVLVEFVLFSENVFVLFLDDKSSVCLLNIDAEQFVPESRNPPLSVGAAAALGTGPP